MCAVRQAARLPCASLAPPVDGWHLHAPTGQHCEQRGPSARCNPREPQGHTAGPHSRWSSGGPGQVRCSVKATTLGKGWGRERGICRSGRHPRRPSQEAPRAGFSPRSHHHPGPWGQGPGTVRGQIFLARVALRHNGCLVSGGGWRWVRASSPRVGPTAALAGQRRLLLCYFSSRKGWRGAEGLALGHVTVGKVTAMSPYFLPP